MNEPSSALPFEVTQATKKNRLSGLSPDVQQTIETQVRGGAITSVLRLTEDGQSIFDVVMTKDNLSRTFSVAEDGRLLNFEVFEFELPTAVKAVIQTEFGRAQLAKIHRETENEETFYAVDLVLDGRTNLLSVAEGGDWWSQEIVLEQAPALVQQAVRRLWGNLDVTQVSKTTQDGVLAYVVEAEEHGRQHNLTVAPDGRLLGRDDELALSLVPVPVQNAVRRQIGIGVLVRIIKSTYDGAVSYEIEATRDGANLEFSVDQAGKVVDPAN